MYSHRVIVVFLLFSCVCVFQAKDEEFDQLVAFFFVIEKGVCELHEDLEAYLSHLQVRLGHCALCVRVERAAVCSQQNYTVRPVGPHLWASVHDFISLFRWLL